jgi:hypothetical protein
MPARMKLAPAPEKAGAETAVIMVATTAAQAARVGNIGMT